MTATPSSAVRISRPDPTGSTPPGRLAARLAGPRSRRASHRPRRHPLHRPGAHRRRRAYTAGRPDRPRPAAPAEISRRARRRHRATARRRCGGLLRHGVSHHHSRGRGVDTTMGFTPLEGLVMATRSGTVDPGLVLWLEEHEHLSPHEVATALEQDSGLKALAGTADMREVQAAAQRHDPDAILALDVYTHRLVGGIAAMTAATAGLDALVFTGGVGERSPDVRRRAAERL